MTVGDEYDVQPVPTAPVNNGYGTMIDRTGEDLCGAVLLRDGSGSMRPAEQEQAQAFLQDAEAALEDAYDEVAVRYGVFQTGVEEVDAEDFYGQTQLQTGGGHTASAYAEGLTLLQSTLPADDRYLLIVSDRPRTVNAIQTMHPEDAYSDVEGVFYCCVGVEDGENALVQEEVDRVTGAATIGDQSGVPDAARLFEDAVSAVRDG